MSYILKHFDTNLLYFDMQKDIDGVSAQILSVNNEHKSLLPLDLELSDHGLEKWLKRRTVLYIFRKLKGIPLFYPLRRTPFNLKIKKDVRRIDSAYAPWCRWSDSNRHGIATTRF